MDNQKELLRENNDSIVLPERAFVFSMHQGYEIRFFILNAEDNPPVVEWYEGSAKGIVKLYDSFEEFLSDSIYQHATFRLVSNSGTKGLLSDLRIVAFLLQIN